MLPGNERDFVACMRKIAESMTEISKQMKLQTSILNDIKEKIDGKKGI